MKTNIKKHINSILFTALILLFSFGISVILQDILDVREHITTVFVFGVFVISVMTDGYFYGIFSAFVSVIAVNFAFTFPFFSFDFITPANFLSALIMIVISLMTGAMTTKLKKWQAIKAESEREKMRANLLRAVSHDLRTPLTSIYGSGSTLLDNYDGLSDHQKIKMISGIKEDSEWLIRMVENLLSVTRINQEHIQLVTTPTVLEELIDSVLLKFKKRYPEQGVSVDIPEEMMIIPMDAILIEQVMVNILENAVQHAVGMTRLSLRVFSEGEHAVFEIEDDGCGIEAERLKNIFIGYYDGAEQPADAQKRNAGIGLSVCATIVRAHGGEISAENVCGKGALFRFTLDKEKETHDQ